MNAIELLMEEHRWIERGLDALEAIGRRIGTGETIDPAVLGRLAALLRALADERHHGKEEQILFETMVKHGFPKEGGPVAMMLIEHDEGRAYVRSLAEIGAKPAWSASDRTAASDAAAGFAMLLREHIMKEDRILYPMARAHLQAWVMDEVDERSRTFEEEWTRAGKADWPELEALVDRILVAA